MRYKIALYNPEEGYGALKNFAIFCGDRTSAKSQDQRHATFRLDDWHKI